jgi:hypothetical protein
VSHVERQSLLGGLFCFCLISCNTAQLFIIREGKEEELCKSNGRGCRRAPWPVILG